MIIRLWSESWCNYHERDKSVLSCTCRRHTSCYLCILQFVELNKFLENMLWHWHCFCSKMQVGGFAFSHNKKEIIVSITLLRIKCQWYLSWHRAVVWIVVFVVMPFHPVTLWHTVVILTELWCCLWCVRRLKPGTSLTRGWWSLPCDRWTKTSTSCAETSKRSSAGASYNRTTASSCEWCFVFISVYDWLIL